tara:strand:+ start:97 stop:474 length:378 start_codon:yes stop_codon:yes gene_type:complete
MIQTTLLSTVAMPTLACKDCGHVKAEGEFDVDRYAATKVIRKRFCHTCRVRRDEELRRAHRMNSLPRPDRCPICAAQSKLVLDHNHDTGLPCGWICNLCNQSVGRMHNPAVLHNFVAYIQKHHSA